MSTLDRIAYFQDRRDEVPNQELAQDLAARKDRKGIREIAGNLWNQERNVQSDCLKVLYEIGYLDPALVADYADDFLKLLESRNNRMVWGGMIALSTIASLRADILFPHVSLIKKVMEKGTIITLDAGIKTLAGIASQKDTYSAAIFPYLLDHLKTCRPMDLPRHAGQIFIVVNEANKKGFIKVLEKRAQGLSGSGLVRLQKVIKEAAKR